MVGRVSGRGRGRARTRTRLWLLTIALALIAPAPVSLAQSAADEREALARTQPTPLVAQVLRPRVPPLTVRLRFYADDDHRAGAGDLPDRLRRTLDVVNRLSEPALGIRFAIESVREWRRTSPRARLDETLDQLEKLDPGRDVDWVVGLVGGLLQISSDQHEVGMARTLGRHFVLRGLASLSERIRWERGYPTLERMNPADLQLAFERRKQHKEAVVFLHEWAHTLGALHVADATHILSPTYTPLASVLGQQEVGLLGAAIADRTSGQPGDWTRLRAFLQTTRTSGWNEADRARLLAALTLGREDHASGAAKALTRAETDAYERAFALHGGRDDHAAWRALAPLVAAHPGAPELEPLLCRLSALPAAQIPGAAACTAALAHAAKDDAGPFVDAAQAALSRQDPHQAQVHAREAAVRAARAHPPDPSAWLAIAQIDLQLGALTWAEAALVNAGAEPGVATTRQQAQGARRFFGLPAAAPGVPPEREPICAAAFTQANAALAARKLVAARTAIDAGLRQCPQLPGLLTLACDVAIREGHPDRAHDHCVAALAGMDDLPRAHFLLGTLSLARGKGGPAVTSFRRAVALDPTEAAYWDGLGEAYAAFGHDRELRALPGERARAQGAGKPP